MGNDDAILAGLTAALNAQDLGAAADEGSAEGGTRQHLLILDLNGLLVVRRKQL